MRDGVETSPMKITGETEKRGTEVHFLPDDDDLQQHRLPLRRAGQAPARAELPEQRRQDQAWSTSATRKEDNFAFAGGVQGLRRLHQHRARRCCTRNIFHAMGDKLSDQGTNIGVEVAMQWNDGYNENVLCFTNNIPQRDGGTHLTGLRAAMTRVINKYIDDNEMAKKAKVEIAGDDMREGLACVVSVKVPEPKFSSQTKDKLVSSEVRGPVEDIVSKLLHRLAAGEPDRRQDHLRQDRRRRPRPRSRAQGARDDAPQGRARRPGPARQAGRLPGEGPGAVRDLHRRGRQRRRQRQAGPRPQVPGDPAAARQDPERREGALRKAAVAATASSR